MALRQQDGSDISLVLPRRGLGTDVQEMKQAAAEESSGEETSVGTQRNSVVDCDVSLGRDDKENDNEQSLSQLSAHQALACPEDHGAWFPVCRKYRTLQKQFVCLGIPAHTSCHLK